MTGRTPIDPLVQEVVDALCNEGCKAVAQSIIDLESGRYPSMVQKLADVDKQIVLQELKEIMAVYDRNDGGD